MISLFASSHPLELSWIASLQGSLRSPFLDFFFRACHYLDTAGFALLVISFVWAYHCPKKGLSLLYILALSGLVSTLLKWGFALPRPCHIDPYLGLFCPRSFGFPSGGAQTATVLFGVTLVEATKRWFKWATFFFALLMCFSRIYLGVHYITDVLGGIACGVCLVIVYRTLFPLLQAHRKYVMLPLVGSTVALAVLCSWFRWKGAELSWVFASVSFLYCYPKKLSFEKPLRLSRRPFTKRFVIACSLFCGIAIIYGVFHWITYQLRPDPIIDWIKPIESISIVLWISLLFPYLLHKHKTF